MPEHFNVLFLCTGKFGSFHHGRSDHESQRARRTSRPTVRAAIPPVRCDQKQSNNWRMPVCQPKVSAARVGTSSRSPTLPNSILSLPFVTTLRKKFVLSGRGSR